MLLEDLEKISYLSDKRGLGELSAWEDGFIASMEDKDSEDELTPRQREKLYDIFSKFYERELC